MLIHAHHFANMSTNKISVTFVHELTDKNSHSAQHKYRQMYAGTVWDVSGCKNMLPHPNNATHYFESQEE